MAKKKKKKKNHKQDLTSDERTRIFDFDFNFDFDFEFPDLLFPLYFPTIIDMMTSIKKTWEIRSNLETPPPLTMLYMTGTKARAWFLGLDLYKIF